MTQCVALETGDAASIHEVALATGTHFEIPVHNVMLVDVIHTFQDLADALAVERGREREDYYCTINT